MFELYTYELLKLVLLGFGSMFTFVNLYIFYKLKN